MKSVLNSVRILLLIVTCFCVKDAFAQSILNPSDPIVVYNSSAPPATPAWGTIAKWVKTNRMSWNTTSYKAYYYNGYAFRLKFPKTYNPTAVDGKKYPMIVFFHGLGERGTIYDNEYSLLHGGEQFRNKVDDGTFDGYILVMQSQNGYWDIGQYNAIKDLINYMVTNNKLDAFRVITNGLSAGGAGTWDMMINNPTYVAAAMPMSSSCACYINTTTINKIKFTPIWNFQGALDPSPAPSTTEAVRDAINAAGGNFRYTKYPNLAHGTWNTAWAEPDFYPFANRAHAANPWPLFGRSEFCPGDAINITIGLAPGYDQYEWRKDGVLIPGATGQTLAISGSAVLENPALGSYSARVRRGTLWSDWSPTPLVVGIKAATVPPAISVKGLQSKVLPALDGKNSVTLNVPNTYQSYLWQREGNTTTISTADTAVAASPGQYKVRVTEQFGCSTDWSSLFTVIDANGPNKPDAAINVVASPLSQNAMQVSWANNPSPLYNETNFEVYRSLTAGGPYTLVGMTNADILSFVDQGLSPKTKYFYVVRAVNNTGAANASNEANATTLSDNIAPTAPANLTVTGTTRNSVSLSWTAATDNVGVTKYDIYVNGLKAYVTSQTTYTVYNLNYGQAYNFTVRARDAADNNSPNSNQVTAQTVLNGLPYKYYTFSGSWANLPNFATLTPAAIGSMPNFALTPRTQDDRFAFLWEGFINIPETGTYFFRTNSDDGSRLWLGSLNGTTSPYSFSGTPLVNNDGVHGAQDRTSVAVTLTQGIYPIAVAFFEQSSGQSLTVSWRTPSTGTSYVTIPNSAFIETVPLGGTAPAAPSGLSANTVSFRQINLSWTDNSNNETGFEIWRSTNATTGFITVGTAAANATNYADSGLNANTTYYYRIRAIGQFGESAFTENLNVPAAIWLFNNNLNDASGNSRTLTQSNNPLYDAADKQEGTHSIRFNGSNQSVTMPTTGSFLQSAFTQRTIAFWMKSNNNTGNRIVVDAGGNDDGLAIRLDANTLFAGVASNNVRNSISTPYSSTGWNHIALVYSGNTLRLFVNGTEVAANTSLSFTSVLTTTNGSRIGTVNGSNAFNTGSGFFNGWIDNFVIYDYALSASNITNLMNNVPVVNSYATTGSLPPAPTMPASLVASGISTSRINVTWEDATNETGYELYKSSNGGANFVLFATLPANTTSFLDTGLFANSIHYYRVRSFNEGASSLFSNDDTAKTFNNVPVLAPVATQYMRFGTTLAVNISATDADPEALTLTPSNLPPFASFTNTGNGQGTISFNNPPATGIFTGITVTVNDQNGGSSAVSFDLNVNDNYVPVITGPGNIVLNEQQTGQLNINATDENALDVLTWSFTGLPSFATPVINAGAVQINLAPGLADHGVYNVTATVNDGNLGIASTSFTITVNNVNPNRKIFINFTDGSFTSPAPWNNTSKPTPSLNDNFPNLLDETGANSGIGLLITSPWQNLGNAVNTFGANTGNNSGVYPDNVMRTCYFTNDAVQTIRIYGLNPAYRYNFTFFGSRAGVTDDRTTVYTIGTTSVTLNAANNSQNTVSINNQQSASDGTLTLTLAKGPLSSFGYLNAMVVESIYDDGTAPAKPRSLTASLQAGNVIRLNWIDAAYNETSYEVYRSATNLPGSFTLLNPGGNNANLQLYNDATAPGNATYYYYVRALNSVGASPNSDTVTISIPNGAPAITAIANVAMKTEQTVNVNITATDAPGDIITLSVTGLPSFATFTNTGNGTGVITITPGTTSGSFTGITVTATDNFNSSSSRQFNISVSDKDVSTYMVNFNQVLPVGSPWNSFNTLPAAGTTINNLVDNAGAPSSVSVTLVDAWDNANDLGASTGNNSGVYPDDVMRTSYFTNTSTAKRIRISGLSTAANVKYNLIFFASRGGVSDNRITAYSYAGQTVSLNAASNTANTVQIQGVVPDASGVIEFTATKDAGAAFGYINALVIQSYVDNGLPLAPSNLTASAISTSSIRLNWMDKSNNEDGFEIYRSGSANGTYTLLTTTAANVTSYTDAGLAPGTVFYYRVRAKRNPNLFSAYTNTAGVSTLQYSVFVNFNQDNPAPAPWNNTNEGPIPDDIYFNLLSGSNTPTGINMTVVGTAFNGVNPWGVNTGNNSGVYPDAVIGQTWWLDANTTAMLRIDGLSIANAYNFTFFASRTCTGCDRTTVYTIGGKSVSLNAADNRSNTVTITGVTPDENGSVLIEIRAGGASPFGYIGALVMDAYISVPGGNGGGGSQSNRVSTGNVTTLSLTPATLNVNQPVTERTNPAQPVVSKVEVSTFPNPFKGDVNVKLSLPEKAERINFTVTDISGRIVLTREIRNLQPGVTVQKVGLEGTNLQPGVYILKVSGLPGNKSETFKIYKVSN
ncbi:MAG: hypothetical protein HEQ40_09775 [Lacibacter sp.]|jgi:predicted esterase